MKADVMQWVRCSGHARYALPCKRYGHPSGPPFAFFCHDHEGQRRRWEHQFYFDAGLELGRLETAPAASARASEQEG